MTSRPTTSVGVPGPSLPSISDLMDAPLSRRERHLAEILQTVSDGDRTRACMLAHEHLVEFADDATFLKVILRTAI